MSSPICCQWCLCLVYLCTIADVLLFIRKNVTGLACCRKQKLGFKRIMLFTNNDNPHPDGQLHVLHFIVLVKYAARVLAREHCPFHLVVDEESHWVMFPDWDQCFVFSPLFQLKFDWQEEHPADKNLGHLSIKVLFRIKWKKKTERELTHPIRVIWKTVIKVVMGIVMCM